VSHIATVSQEKRVEALRSALGALTLLTLVALSYTIIVSAKDQSIARKCGFARIQFCATAPI